MQTGIHDNRVSKYIIDCENKEIIFNTKTEKNGFVDIVFKDVSAYFFENTIIGCIIFDIEDISIEDFIYDLGEDYILEHRKYGWPLDFDDMDDLEEKMKEGNIQIFSFSTSYGMSGHILAKEMKVLKNAEEPIN